MHKGRRVGTLTTGIILILSGAMFLCHLVYPRVSYLTVISYWPVILILLGIEVIIAYVINREDKIVYDTGAIWLVAALSFFAMGMGGLELVITNITKFSGLI